MRPIPLALLLAALSLSTQQGLSAQTPVGDEAGGQRTVGDEAVDRRGVEFVRDVAPILQAHCDKCHGPDKQKGNLRLDRREFVFHDDADEWSVRPKDPDASELIYRIQLPLDDDEIMPQESDPLTPAQIATLRSWVAAGATWPDGGDEYFAAAAAAAVVPKIDFGIAEPDEEGRARIGRALEALRERGVLAERVAADTPAVDVNASLLGKAFTDADVALLRDLAPVLVWLNLGRTAITDEAAAMLGELPQLRRLSLANTMVGDGAMALLARLPRLEVLNVYGSRVGDAGLAALETATALRRIYAYDSAVTAAGARAFAAARPEVGVDRGDYAEERLQQAEAEIRAREERDRPVNATCPVTGEAVSSEHVVEHDGLRIGFCCAKCQKKFAADPAAFADKVAEYREAAAPAGDQPKTPKKAPEKAPAPGGDGDREREEDR